MKRRIALVLTTFGIAIALGAAPIGLQGAGFLLDGKSALAAPGNGKGHGRGQGPGNSTSLSVQGGSGPGRSGSAPGHGGTGHGQAVGHDAVSGVSSHTHLNGLSASDLGNLNAAHASAQAFENAAANSMVGAIAAAVEASFVDVPDDDEFVDKAEIDLVDFEAALAGIGNKTVDGAVADAVGDLVDGKVSEPAP